MIQEWFDYCLGIPLIGQRIFTFLLNYTSPYTSTIGLTVTKLDCGSCEGHITESYTLRNPFNSIHAAALLNLGEAVGGLAVLTLAESRQMRAIVTSLQIEFHRKARGKISACARMDASEFPAESGHCAVITELTDNVGIVAVVTAQWKVSALASTKKIR